MAESIRKFRGDEIVMIPGGGGDYGERIIPESEAERKKILEDKASEIECRYEN